MSSIPLQLRVDTPITTQLPPKRSRLLSLEELTEKEKSGALVLSGTAHQASFLPQAHLI